MKPQLTDQLIAEILEILKNTKDFVLEQAPLVVQEIYRWSMFSSLFCAICGFIGMCIGGALLFKGYQVKKAQTRSYEIDAFPWVFGGAIILTITLSFFMVAVLNIIKIHLAPKLFLIEYLSRYR